MMKVSPTSRRAYSQHSTEKQKLRICLITLPRYKDKGLFPADVHVNHHCRRLCYAAIQRDRCLGFWSKAIQPRQ